MVIKTLETRASTDRRQQAGYRAEERMAHYLRREFDEDAGVLVFHDLRLEQEDDAAQIDHLLFHRYGAIIVESKSVQGEVTVNEHGEWIRKWNGRPQGMASPIEQARRQGEFLRDTLQLHREQLRGRVLLGLMQGGFRHMPIDLLVAISDDGVIRRPKSPRMPEVHKADLIPGQIKCLLAEHRRVNSLFSHSTKGGYELSKDDLSRISEFLLARHQPRGRRCEPEVHEVAPVLHKDEQPRASQSHQCRHCQSGRLTILSGPHSYYFKCDACDGNTPIREQCAGCGQKKRIRKRGPFFIADCERCGTSAHFFSNHAEVS